MRRPALIFVLCGATAASARPDAIKHPGDKPKPIDVAPVADKLDVFRDDLGNYYVVPSPTGFDSSDAASTWLFYGDGKTMYQQRMIGFGQEGADKRSWNVWSPRARGIATAEIDIVGDKAFIECRAKDGQRPLTPLKADEAKTVLTHAKFLPPLWIRISHYLARDDDGTYYFVDQLRDDYGGAGFRVFIGLKGSMKEAAMTNIVSDSAGEIFATKSGQLKIIAGRDGKAFWIKGDKKTELTVLEPQENRYLIYRELGVYGQLGTVCDDL